MRDFVAGLINLVVGLLAVGLGKSGYPCGPFTLAARSGDQCSAASRFLAQSCVIRIINGAAKPPQRGT